MSRKRKAQERLPCGECLATGYNLCRNKRTGKEMKNFHSSRRIAGRNDALNREVAEIDKEGETESFFLFAWEAFGLAPSKYPPPGKPYWHFMPELDPADQYHGNF